jgi:hypothetical protein
MTDDELLANLQAVLDGTGAHAEHERRQIGRCVHCSCGTRVQGRGQNLSDPKAHQGFQVRLADGFVCWTGPTRWRANEIAAKHPGAVVEHGTPAPVNP